MSTVFFDVGVSLDGYIAGPNGRPGNPLGDGGLAIHEWMFKTATFHEHLGLPGRGETSADDALVKEVFRRSGAYVLGRRMFDEGEVGWPETPPFRAPVFVLTHAAREPWVRKGGTTFFFVTDGIESALNPHISHLFVARRLKGAWMSAFPTEGCAGVVDTTLSSPTEGKSAAKRLSDAAVEEV